MLAQGGIRRSPLGAKRGPGSKHNLSYDPLRPKGELRRPKGHPRAPRSDRDAGVAKLSFRMMPRLNAGRLGSDSDDDSSLDTHTGDRLRRSTNAVARRKSRFAS